MNAVAARNRVFLLALCAAVVMVAIISYYVYRDLELMLFAIPAGF